MATRSLTLIGSATHAPRPTPADDAFNHWPPHDRPPVQTASIEQVLTKPAVLNTTAVAWVLLQEDAPPELGRLVTLLQDRGIPAMVSQFNESKPAGADFKDGIVIAPPDAGPAALCAMLRTLWNQARIVQSLQDELHLLHAHQGGLCNQINKLDEELRFAAQLQRESLPSALPRLGGLQFQVLYRPAGYVSGDMYDVLQLDDKHVGVFLADAIGHGVPAALITMYIKRSLLTKQFDATRPGGYRIVPPNETLARLNEDMIRLQTGRVRFATACYGIINAQTLELSLARAGHPFPIILRADGGTETLEPDGLILGVMPDRDFQLAHTRLNPGDRLLLYSDGFELAFPQRGAKSQPDRRRANSQHTRELKDLAHGPLDEALKRLADKLDKQAGSLNQRDDLTALCLAVGEPQPARDDSPQTETEPAAA